MFEWIREKWDNHGFEIILGLCLVTILILALCRIGKKGSWSSSYAYTRGKGYKQILHSQKKHLKESSGEKECRRVLQKLFGKPFNNSRPNFLRNPVTGGRFNLELDCFDSYLRLAVEYSGAQHYKYIPYFHKNKAVFRNQQYRDYMKKIMCRDNGITLIEVPYTVKVSDIERFLVDKLRQVGYKV